MTTAANSSVHHLAAAVSRIASIETFGGQCRVLDSTRCALYDVAMWDDDHTARLRQRFPHVSVSVSALDSSLTGFILVFQLHETSHRPRDTLLFAVVLCCLAVLTYTGFMIVEDVVPLAPACTLRALSDGRQWLGM